MKKNNHKLIIYVYGFDKLGFPTSNLTEEGAAFNIKFINYGDDASLDEADGLIIPSGVFEEFYETRDYLEGKQLNVRFDVNMLASREKELFNASKKGIWTAFLLQKVDNGGYKNWEDTDLAKKFLNIFATNVRSHDPIPYVMPQTDEFRKYIEKFGLAQTSFTVKDSDRAVRILANQNDTPVALEVKGQFFFLPFFTTKKEKAVASTAAHLVTSAILEYKRKNDIYLPAWLNKLQFKTEMKIQNEVKLAEEQLIKLSEETERWARYKALLCTSGQNLSSIITGILRDFFGLNMKSEEKYIEDALIFSPADELKYVVEIKGVNGGIKRENINQVDSHRERLEINPKIPGLLIVNDFMDVEDFDERKQKTFDENNLNHAKNHNVKVLRTVTLFELMLAFEEESQDSRRSAFFEFCDKSDPLVVISAK